MLTFGKISALLVFVGVVPYIWQTITGKVRPERASWFVWFALGFIALWGQAVAGGHDSLWLTISQTALTGIVFVLSIFRGVGGFTKFDLKCLALAALGVVIWRISSQPGIAILGVIFADAMGTIPTARKAYFDPDSEASFSWGIDVLSGAFGVLAVGSLDPILLAYPVYFTLSVGTVFVMIMLGHRRQNRLVE